MKVIPWLDADAPFPKATSALRSPNGLLAAGGDLSTPRLLQAYRNGIFPWFNAGEPILWWNPDRRMVIFPPEMRISRSLARLLRNKPYRVSTNSAFEEVMRLCAAPRRGQHGTWIHEQMISAYCELHRLGFAHSVEIWMGEQLAGGLYGVSMGRMFFAESMFSRVSNASKIALAHLARQLERWQASPFRDGVPPLPRSESPDPSASPPAAATEFVPAMIDCQMHTPHLASLGAREISRAEFIKRVQELVNCEPVADWRFDPDLFKQ